MVTAKQRSTAAGKFAGGFRRIQKVGKPEFSRRHRIPPDQRGLRQPGGGGEDQDSAGGDQDQRLQETSVFVAEITAGQMMSSK